MKFGELDIVAASSTCMHIVEVKSLRCLEFPTDRTKNLFDPGENLHQGKINKVARAAAWYVESLGWEGEWTASWCGFGNTMAKRKSDTTPK